VAESVSPPEPIDNRSVDCSGSRLGGGRKRSNISRRPRLAVVLIQRFEPRHWRLLITILVSAVGQDIEMCSTPLGVQLEIDSSAARLGLRGEMSRNRAGRLRCLE